jgi:hypothetical protein
MYGIVNKSIEELVIANFGQDNWDKVLEKSGIEEDFFISSQPYDDDITYKLAGAAAEVMNVTVNDVLQLFGEWWVLKTSLEKYQGLMQSGGSNLQEFLLNLPAFHNRIMLIYPKLTPPEFKISDIHDGGLNLHYYSKRPGLQEFVRGILVGLGKMFEVPVEIELIKERSEGHDHEIFKINW